MPRMRAATFVLAVLNASLALTVFSLGLTAGWTDTRYLLRNAGLLARSLIAMNVILPLVALWMALVVPLDVPVKLAIVALAISPVPPFLPRRIIKAGGDAAYTISLLIVASVASIVFIPLTMWVFSLYERTSVAPPILQILRIVVTGILLPLALGIGVRSIFPQAATRAARAFAIAATVALVAAVVPLLIRTWSPMLSLLGNGTVLALIALCGAGLGIGHVLGGPKPDDRSVLAIATATRHPGVAIAIADATFPGQKLSSAAILLDLIIVAVATVPYLRRARRVARERRAWRAIATQPARRSTDNVPRAASPPTRT